MRRLVLFADGTWRRWRETNNSNVVKLRAITLKTDEQRPEYDPGVGTNFSKFTGGAFGVGISKNIRDLYSFIVENQERGCEICLFGFSRGAFTVRSLGGMLDRLGVLEHNDEKLIKQAFNLYKKGDRAKAAAEAFSEAHAHFDFTIRVIGVWETVGSLGVPFAWLNRLNPFSHRFHDTHLGKRVKVALHAVSIDESRYTFKPTLWTRRQGEGVDRPEQVIHQVWFAGDHSDVGGGYDDHRLADVALQWMIDQLRVHDVGLELLPRPEWPFAFDADSSGATHSQRRWLYRFWKVFQRRIDDDAAIHESVKARLQDPDLGYRPRNLPPEPSFVGDEG